MMADPTALTADRGESPLPRPLRVLGRVEPLYRRAVARRNKQFDRGERVWRAPLPVISVGNISVGGTGKSPVVARLAREMLKRGVTPVIAMRGYKKSDGQTSDEEQEYLDSLPGVRVLAHPDRAGSIAAFLDEGGEADCVLLDDGFQHRFVARDLDIVLVDATRDPFSDRCLPAGWLREPVESLKRADAVIVTRVDRVASSALDTLLDRVSMACKPGSPLATCVHSWARIDRYSLPGDHPGTEDLESLRRRRLFLLTGIGNPAALRAQIHAVGARLVGERLLSDHAKYTEASIVNYINEARLRGAGAVLTTAKDWVKIRRVLSRGGATGLEWLVPRVEIEFTSGGDGVIRAALAAASRPRSER